MNRRRPHALFLSCSSVPLFLSAPDPLSPSAIAHNDKSVLESHHLSLGWTVLTTAQGSQPALLGSLFREDRLRLRRILIALVLATDLRSHFDNLAAFQERFSFTPPPNVADPSPRLGGLPVDGAAEGSGLGPLGSPISNLSDSLGTNLHLATSPSSGGLSDPLTRILLTSEDRLAALEMVLKARGAGSSACARGDSVLGLSFLIRRIRLPPRTRA